MRLVFRVCKDFALCQVGKESSIYITSLEAGPGPGEQQSDCAYKQNVKLKISK
jgi:hypothetical protein